MPAPIRREQLSVDVGAGSGKSPCRLATTVNDTLSGLAARDGVTPVAGDRVLVKDQTTPSQNGIYAASAGAWSRTLDYDDNADVDPGGLITVAEGTASGGTAWQLTTAAPITLGSTSLTFELIGIAGSTGAHAADHLPNGSDPLTTATAVGLDGASTSAEGTAESFARSDHTHAIDDSTGVNSTVNAGDAAADGTAVGFSKKDHQHAVATAVPTGAVEIGDTGVEGVASDLARSDHIHPVAAPAAPADVTKAAAVAGSAVEAARADHKHDVTTAAAVNLAEVNAEGVATTLARSDHTHDHGNRSGGTLHAAATTGVAGFMSATDKTKLDTLVDPNLRDPKDSVRAKSTANLATLSGPQTVDGVALVAGNRVLLSEQTTTTEDGIYDVNAGAWTRSADFQLGSSQAGAVIPVEEGTSNTDTLWLMTNNEPNDVVGTDDLAFGQIGAGSPRGAGAGLVLNANDLDVVANADGSLVVNPNDMQVGVLATDAQHGVRGGGTQHADVIAGGADGFMTGADKTKIDGIAAGAEVNDIENVETVATETITNSDTAMTDTLNATPLDVTKVGLFLNGIRQRYGAGNDFTISGTTITWLAATGTAANMKTTDSLDAQYLS